jgi:phosphodiesterase/alkaline phosphatase D-like protein
MSSVVSAVTVLLFVAVFTVLAPNLSRAETVVNVTFHTPAQVETNPCTPGDVVNLSGDIHVVIASTADNAGGYRMKTHLNSQLSGTSITTGTDYVHSENNEDEWYARPPFPYVHTTTYDFLLVSKSGTDNYLLRMTMHQTVDANGVPTAAVENFSMKCAG